jgi:chromosome segregation ATPase
VAEIEIELAAHKNSPVHIIRRVIDKTKGAESGKGYGSNSYFINNKSVNIKAVQTLVKDTYNISIENLCTFLPQDRVGSFSAIDAKGLLHETEKSLSGSQQLYHDHMALIRLEEEFHSSGTDLTVTQNTLENLERDQARLEHEKQKLEERERYLQQIKLLKQKKVWLLFDQAREKTNEFKEKRQALKDKTKDAEALLQPMKDQVEAMSHDVDRAKAKCRDMEKNITSSWKNFDTGHKTAEKIMDEIENSMESLQSLDASRQQKEKRVREFRAKLTSHEKVLAEYPPMEELEDSARIAKEQVLQARRLYGDLKRVAESKMAYVPYFVSSFRLFLYSTFILFYSYTTMLGESTDSSRRKKRLEIIWQRKWSR